MLTKEKRRWFSLVLAMGLALLGFALLPAHWGAAFSAPNPKAQRAPQADVNLQIEKTLHTGTPIPGSDIQYRIWVFNNYGVQATDVVITDVLPAAITYVSDSNNDGFTTRVDGDTVVFSKDTLGGYTAAYIYLTVHISNTVTPNSILTNTVFVTSSDNDTDTTDNYDALGTAVLTPTRNLVVNKDLAGDSPKAAPGNDIRYQIEYRNDGTAVANSVWLTDTLPQGLTYVAHEPADWTTVLTGPTLVLSRATLDAGDSGYVYLTAHVSETLTPDTVLTNTVVITGAEADEDLQDNGAEYSVTVITPTWDMTVSTWWTSAGSRTPGARMQYGLSYQNLGNATAHNVVITDTLPVSVTYEPGTATVEPTVVGNQLVWDLGSVSPRASTNWYFSLRLAEQIQIGTRFTNTAYITATIDENPNDNTDWDVRTVETGTSNVYVSKSLVDSYLPQGAEVVYDLEYGNSTQDSALGVVLTDTLPPGVQYIGSDGPFEPTRDGDKLIWDLGVVPQGSDNIYVTIYVPDNVAVGTPLTNTLVITASNEGAGGDSDNFTQLQRTVVTRSLDLGVSKSRSRGQPVLGTDMTYHISYQNYGNARARDVVITDTLPAGVAFVSATPLTPTQVGHRLVWAFDSMPGQYTTGYAGSIQVTVHISDTVTDGTQLCNQVVITTTDKETSNANANRDSHCDTAEAPKLDVGVSKSLYGNSPPPLPGNEIYYRITCRNHGNLPAHNIVLTDTLPPTLTYTSHAANGWTLVMTDPVVFTRTELAAEANSYLSLYARVADAADPGTELVNTVEVITSDSDEDLSNNTAEHTTLVETPTWDMHVIKTLLDAPLSGHKVTYQINYQNEGNAPAHDVVLTDTLPSQLIYLGHSAVGWSVVQTGTILVLTRAEVSAGGTGAVDIDVLIPNTLSPGDVFTNTVAIATSDADIDPNDDTYRLVTMVVSPTRDVSVDKFLSSGSKVPGETIRYRLSVQNSGNFTATDIVLTDTLPAGVTYDSYSASGWTVVLTAPQVVLTRSHLSAYANQDLYLTVRILSSTVKPKTLLTNTAQIATADPETSDANNTADYTFTTLSPNADLAIAKHWSGGQRAAGKQLVYRIDYQNLGAEQASNVIITDTLPPGMTYAGWRGTDSWLWDFGQADNVITWTRSSLGSGSDGYLQVTANISDTVVDGARLTNTVEIASDAPNDDLSDNQDALGLTIAGAARDVSISKSLSGVGVLVQGQLATYTLQCVNGGDVAAANVLVTDTLPADVTFVSASDGGVYANGKVTWNLGRLVGNANQTLQLTVRVPETVSVGSSFCNRATISTSDEETGLQPNSAEQCDTVEEPAWDVYVNKSLGGTPLAGAEVTYDIYYGNQGNMPAYDVVITETLPSNVTYLSHDAPSAWRVTQVDPQVIVFRRPQINAKISGNFNVKVRISDQAQVGDLLVNWVEIATSSPETVRNNNTSSDSTSVVAPTRDVQVVKSVDNLVVPGGSLQYNLSFRNSGNSPAHDVRITDTLPADITYLSWSGELSDVYYDDYEDELAYLVTPIFYPDNRVVWHLKELGAGDNGTIYITARVTNTAKVSDTLVNIVAITCGERDENTFNNVYTLTTTLSDFTRDMYGKKSKDWESPPPVPGQTFEYRIYFKNNGTATAHGVVITDTLPITVEYDSWRGSLYNPDSIALPDLISPTMSADQRTLVWTLPSLVRAGHGYIYIRVRVKDNAQVGEDLVNEVTISTSDVDINTSDNYDSATNAVVAPKTDMYVDKILYYGTPGTPGGWMAYQIYFYNQGNVTANNVVVSDTLPAGVSLVSWNGYAYNPDHVTLPSVVPLVQEGQTLSWNLGDLVYGAYGYLYLWVQVADTTQIGDGLDNVVRVTYAGDETTPSGNVYTLTTTLADKIWEIYLDKDNEGKSAYPGGTMEYDIKYNTNASNWPATHVMITDTLPPSATLESWYGYGYHPSDYVDLDDVITPTQTADGKVVWNLGTLPPGSSGTIYITVRIDADAKVWDRIYNHVAVSSAEDAWYTDEEQDRVILPLQDLHIYKYLESEPGTPGSQMTYELYFGNAGNIPVSNVAVTDTLPPGTSLAHWYGDVYTPAHSDLESVITPTQAGDGTLIWNIGDLPAGAYGRIYPTVNISADLSIGDRLTNVVDIGGDSDDFNPINNHDELVTMLADAHPDLNIAKSIHNLIHLRVPSALDYAIAASRYAPFYNPMLVQEKDTAAESEIHGRRPDQDEYSERLAFQQHLALEQSSSIGGEIYDLTPAAGLVDVAPGQDIEYRLTFKNEGNVPASNVMVSDTLPAHTTFVSWYGYVYTPEYHSLHDGVTPTQSGDQVTWNIGTLGVGHYGYIYVTVHVSATAPVGTGLVNRADVASDEAEDDMTNNTATVSATVQTPANHPPTANAGPDQFVQVGTNVTLDGSGSNDPDGDTLTYGWAQTSGPSVTLSDSSAEMPTFTASTTGTLTFQLTVTDTGDLSARDRVVITVTAGPPPTCPFPLTDVAIDGLNITDPNTPITLSARITPANATQPVTYTWQPAPSSGQGTHEATYQWANPGFVTLTLTVENCGGSFTARHLVLVRGNSVETPPIDPAIGTTLIYTYTDGLTTTIQVPPGAVERDIMLIYTPIASDTLPAPPTGLRFSNRTFDLSAFLSGRLLRGYLFSKPVTITLRYSDADIRGLDEAELRLYYWDEEQSQWVDAIETCQPPSSYHHDLEKNLLAVPICHLSDWGILSIPSSSSTIYLPLVLRD